jgi:hypothetical protein
MQSSSGAETCLRTSLAITTEEAARNVLPSHLLAVGEGNVACDTLAEVTAAIIVRPEAVCSAYSNQQQ